MIEIVVEISEGHRDLLQFSTRQSVRDFIVSQEMPCTVWEEEKVVLENPTLDELEIWAEREISEEKILEQSYRLVTTIGDIVIVRVPGNANRQGCSHPFLTDDGQEWVVGSSRTLSGVPLEFLSSIMDESIWDEDEDEDEEYD